MTPRYQKGQQVIIRPVKEQELSPRDFDLEAFAGQRGVVTDFYWITLERGLRVVYLYTVETGDDQKELVLHEDELEPYLE